MNGAFKASGGRRGGGRGGGFALKDRRLLVNIAELMEFCFYSKVLKEEKEEDAVNVAS